MRFTQRLLDAGIAPSTGGVGDNFDNALSDNRWSTMKIELISWPATTFATRAEPQAAFVQGHRRMLGVRKRFMARWRCRVGWCEFSPPVVHLPLLPVLDRLHHHPMRHRIASELLGDPHPRLPVLPGQQLRLC